MEDSPQNVTKADLEAAVAQINRATQETMALRQTPEAVGKFLDARITGMLNMVLRTFSRRLNVIVLLLFSFMALINVSILQRVAHLPTDILTDMAYGTVVVYIFCLLIMLVEIAQTGLRKR